MEMDVALIGLGQMQADIYENTLHADLAEFNDDPS